MDRWAVTACAALVFALTAAASIADAQIRAETIATGLRNPVAVVADPTDPATLLVVEQAGLIRVVLDGAVLPTPFLDLRAAISSGGERGLLGLALAPDYAESRRLFVNFTDRNGDTVVARFRRRVDDRLTADPESRFDLQWPDGRRVVEQPFANHNGGHLAFGPDGYLYIGLGDGGSGGDPFDNAQNPRTLLGKMLRIDVGVADDDPRGYRVPEDNPFVDGDPIAALAEIWAFGLRNPWRYSFDDWTRGGTGALTIGDVGQNAREELNFEPRTGGGRNYGWRLREGRQGYDGRTGAAFLPLIEPMHDYGRNLGASVTGGVIYRGAALDPSYNGRYFYADFVSGRIFSLGLHLDPTTSEAAADDVREHTQALGGNAAAGMVSSYGVDHQGEMLVLNYTAGRVLRIVPDLAIVPGQPRVTATQSGGELTLSWSAPAGGVAAIAFAVEVIRGGALLTRVETDRLSTTVEGVAGDCARVRAIGRNGAGPPSAPVCFSEPAGF
jgi:glucose/arabinose dehydrogenase